ncbi:MAG: 3-methyl-2-oxobutanoate hydroxymethyltransferase [Candidatus Marinimicrobia bacterium]|nr:3-methyl-2-oxobutanoate hydroxymethyltransferase [Candidatus Neomarinimicrobiota bacterium]MDD5581602.1 3-methyl-2-oxobutanoate hydroxymethyltransferase [Candidatus Neomarinimicrobiota bacterium]
MEYGTDERKDKVSVRTLQMMKKKGEKIAALTAYDALFAEFLDEWMDIILVGDSLGMVIAGYDTTIPVTMNQMVLHTQYVRRGTRHALLVADMPFLSYQVSPEEAVKNAGRLLKEGGAEAVKLEGGKYIVDAVKRCVQAGIPVMGHLGLTPQSIHAFGGWQTRAKKEAEAQQLKEDALILQDAGIFSLVLEKIPATLAEEVTQSLNIPTIGIGAGNKTDGQILVTQDMLGLYEKIKPKFVRKYTELSGFIREALKHYQEDVKSGAFPSEEESF